MSDIFDIEKATAEWRGQMLGAGIESPVPLEELESHLREEVEAKMQSGLDARQAFESAVNEIGRPDMIKNEFKKIGGVGRLAERLMIGVCAGFVGLILFLGSATVVMCFSSVGDRVMAAVAMASSLAVAFAWRYGVAYLPVIAKRWKRLAVGFGCVVAGFGAANFYLDVIVERFVRMPGGGLPPSGLWAVFIIAVFCCAGVGLIMDGKGREKLGIGRS